MSSRKPDLTKPTSSQITTTIAVAVADGNGHRKFAYSLTDKYKGGYDELLQRNSNDNRAVAAAQVYDNSQIVTSSDGDTSYVIPSENEQV